MVACISWGGYEIASVFDRYYETPAIFSFATNFTPASEIPFPAVTICPSGTPPLPDAYIISQKIDIEENFAIVKSNLS
jgi:hypothetical protein